MGLNTSNEDESPDPINCLTSTHLVSVSRIECDYAQHQPERFWQQTANWRLFWSGTNVLIWKQAVRYRLDI